VRRIAAVAALLAVALAVTAVAQGGRPRLEQKRLRAADMALAKRTTLRASDLAAGWVRRPATKIPDELPRCPGADLDFSAFTITGRAQSTFERSGTVIESLVEVFKSRDDAVGDFRKGTAPKLMACFGPELRRQGIDVVSTKLIGRPALGERAVAYRIVMSVLNGLTPTRVYMDLLGFQRGRTIVGLYFTGTKPISGGLAVARSVAARMR
jgi:hypothetical protein